MIEINNPKIDIDRIKACISEEVARYEAMDDLQDAQEELPPETEALFDVTPPPAPVDKARLFQFHGQEFIHEAYQAILCREPDLEGGRQYFEKLMSGRLTRVDILGRLRYSREGRRLKVRVPGLLPSFLAHSFFKVPVLGWGTRVVTGVLNFPALMRYIQRLESEAYSRYREFEKQVSTVQLQVSDLKEVFEGLKNEYLESHLALSGRMLEQKTRMEEQKTLMEEQKIMLLDSRRQVETLLEAVRAGRTEGPLPPSVAAEEQDRLLDGMYVAFENRFRGTRKEIKKRLSVYIPRVTESLEKTSSSLVLDLGCGRGEWLELLKENQIPAAGLDMNRMMVEICTGEGLDAVRSDAVTYLRQLAPESIGVITGFHIVEHLPFDYLIALLDESRRVLFPGGMVIFETPNPENIQVGACDFYTDPTHRNPIPPQTLCFLVEARGFVDPSIVRLHPAEGIKMEDPFLNHGFSVGRDYAVMGYRK